MHFKYTMIYFDPFARPKIMDRNNSFNRNPFSITVAAQTPCLVKSHTLVFYQTAQPIEHLRMDPWVDVRTFSFIFIF